MKNDCLELRQKLEELQLYKTMLESREQERKTSDAKKYLMEIRFHTRTNQQLKAQLDGIMTQKDT